MNRVLLVPASLAIAGLLGGCSFAARSPEMYRDDTATVLKSKSDTIRACYDDVLKGTPGASGKVTVKFDVEPEQGTITNVTVDAPNTTAPAPVSECVTKNIAGLSLTPPDANKGLGSWVYEFKAPPPPAPAAAAAKTAPKG
jgi:hypothetical protein